MAALLRPEKIKRNRGGIKPSNGRCLLAKIIREITVLCDCYMAKQS